jgi:hypothetical protein
MAEWVLHTDEFLYRYRSVFAAGRAMDKMRYVEAHVPHLLVAGNSRMDNGIDPERLMQSSTLPGEAFNMGLPGANARVLYGIFQRLGSEDLLGAGKIEYVLVGLDEGTLQAEEGLGYNVFFADRAALWHEGAYRDWLASLIRLWGFSANLKELREPEKALRFFQATVKSIEPIGGGAAEHFGYRAGFAGRFQDAGQVQRQEGSYDLPPDPHTVNYLFNGLDLLRSHGVRVAIVYPPLRDRTLLFNTHSSPLVNSYQEIARQLTERGIPTISVEPNEWRNPDEFINAGHLNDKGAQRYSRTLGQRLHRLWPDLWRKVTL